MPIRDLNTAQVLQFIEDNQLAALKALGLTVNDLLDYHGETDLLAKARRVNNQAFLDYAYQLRLNTPETANSKSLLHFAILCLQPIETIASLAKEHNIHKADSEGKTAVHYAIILNNKPILTALLNHAGITTPANAVNADNLCLPETPLQFIANFHENRADMVAILGEFGGDPSIEMQEFNLDGINSPLAKALSREKEFLSTIAAMIAISPIDSLESEDFQDMRALDYAITYHHPELIKPLVKRGAKINAKNSKGDYPLHLALIDDLDDDPTMILALLQNGADINAADENGNTALMIAVQRKKLKCAEALCHFGADHDYINHSGQSALNMATNISNENDGEVELESKPVPNTHTSQTNIFYEQPDTIPTSATVPQTSAQPAIKKTLRPQAETKAAIDALEEYIAMREKEYDGKKNKFLMWRVGYTSAQKIIAAKKLIEAIKGNPPDDLKQHIKALGNGRLAKNYVRRFNLQDYFPKRKHKPSAG